MALNKVFTSPSSRKVFALQNEYFSSNIPNHWESHSYKWDNNNDDVTHSNRMRAITSYYFQSAIDTAAAKQSVRLTPTSLLYTGHNADRNHILVCLFGIGRFNDSLFREVRSIFIGNCRSESRTESRGFRSLPFIVAINPTILAVHELYIKSFKALSQFPAIRTLGDEENYSALLRTLLNNHKDVLTNLAEGLRESQKHVNDNQLIKSILDRTLTSRLGVRMLAEHHLALKETRLSHIGIINVNFSPYILIKSHAEHVGENFLLQYGVKPIVEIEGHTDITFPYIRQPLDYVVNELLKNAFRATMEAHKDKPVMPPIEVTLISNDDDFIIKISDQGQGIPKSIMKRVWDYHFTCNHWSFVNDEIDSDLESSGYPAMGLNGRPSMGASDDRAALASDPDDAIGLSQISQNSFSQPLHGFGFGLPTSKAYAEYLGGSLKIESMRGYGSDVYLCLRHMDGKSESFRI